MLIRTDMAVVNHTDFNFSGLIVSVFTLFLSAMFVLSSVGPAIVTDSLDPYQED